MLHPNIVADILDAEIEVTAARLADGIRSLSREGSYVYAQLTGGTTLRFDGSRYDTDPYDVAVLDAAKTPLPEAAWPPGLNHGQHPILNRPFICIRGTGEYHAHPSHLSDPWDLYRGRIALADLLGHIIRRIPR